MRVCARADEEEEDEEQGLEIEEGGLVVDGEYIDGLFMCRLLKRGAYHGCAGGIFRTPTRDVQLRYFEGGSVCQACRLVCGLHLGFWTL